MGLSDEDRAILQQAQERARARMSGRTIDETGKDISEPQQQPELIRTGWYWTGRYVVWVVGPTANGRGVYYQTTKRPDWLPVRSVTHWRRVHDAVQESGQGFGWKPNRTC